jgi:hypothetical protein
MSEDRSPAAMSRDTFLFCQFADPAGCDSEAVPELPDGFEVDTKSDD